ncbi:MULTISPECIES: hypothetical protein [unclassified Halanaerobium]|uniref:hypothetical protein n=1 Tax=unclassified Halanaerobium TaxID=2641197 RepID=UPI000DF2CD0A|nr:MULTISPECIES: hypothetical protein [unclassified Halanaerobium]RCW45369.1 hypothetical protein DFR78_1171 [Halanaerobium sp. MA284_MarDTE_T2]RCW82547.1 hypothetical protein DER71_1191 [Halanaerobium sp. DL-01]
MTDQIYYKIQYPLKKAITLMKKIDREDNVDISVSESEKEKIKDFVFRWNNGGKKQLHQLINNLRDNL